MNEDITREFVTFKYGLYVNKDLTPFALFPTSSMADLAMATWACEYTDNNYYVKKLEKDVTYVIEIQHTKVAEVY